MSTCEVCGREYIYNRSAGHRKNKCNSCYINVRRVGLKQKSIDYKGGKCQRCGYDKNTRALSFHHLDPEQKEFTIGGCYTRSWDAITKELDKCILVCLNCHMEIEDELCSGVTQG